MTIRTATLNRVLTIEIARPEKKNALTQAMYTAMAEALIAATADASVRAVLITGQPGIFTSGNDIEDFMQRPPSGASGPSTGGETPVAHFMNALLDCDKPVVAAVTGAAIGACLGGGACSTPSTAASCGLGRSCRQGDERSRRAGP